MRCIPVLLLLLTIGCASEPKEEAFDPLDMVHQGFQSYTPMTDSSPKDVKKPSDFFSKHCNPVDGGNHYSKTSYFCTR